MERGDVLADISAMSLPGQSPAGAIAAAIPCRRNCVSDHRTLTTTSRPIDAVDPLPRIRRPRSFLEPDQVIRSGGRTPARWNAIAGRQTIMMNYTCAVTVVSALFEHDHHGGRRNLRHPALA
jgi:alkylhydroperoxidase family enzyme